MNVVELLRILDGCAADEIDSGRSSETSNDGIIDDNNNSSNNSNNSSNINSRDTSKCIRWDRIQPTFLPHNPAYSFEVLETHSSKEEGQNSLKVRKSSVHVKTEKVKEFLAPFSDSSAIPKVKKSKPNRRLGGQQKAKTPNKQITFAPVPQNIPQCVAKKVKMPKLCRFLYKLLQDPHHSACITWIDVNAKIFKITRPGEVAHLWGSTKHKPQMKYEHFARTLRGYVSRGLLKKPHKKLYYQFI